MTKYYPIMLDISNRKCCVIGGGKVALRKVNTLLEYNADITVISPESCEELRNLSYHGKINLVQRSYISGDFDNAYMVFAATDNANINQQIAKEALNQGIMINVADSPELCSFIVPSKIEQGDLTIAISTNGKSPLLAKKIRQELEEKYGSNYAEFLTIIGNIRNLSLKEISDGNKREELFREIVYSQLLDKLKILNPQQIKDEIHRIFEKYKDSKG